jgi:Pentapeptide repeats (8 copies)
LTRQGQVAERFTRAVDQLGSAKLEQRLGGIYGLERIAKDAPETDIRLVVAEVLTAYVRRHAPAQQKNINRYLDSVAPLRERAPDVHAAMAVLGRRTTMAADPPLNLRNVDLRKADLQGAQLQRADLTLAQLMGSHLEQAQLQGAFLTHARLGSASLNGAHLERANLNHAQMSASFQGAHLQQALIWQADLRNANLGNAELQDANLRLADLSGAGLDGAQLQGANLNDAKVGASLTGAQLQGATLYGAQLQESYKLTEADLRDAIAGNNTVWPSGFDWKAAGVRIV